MNGKNLIIICITIIICVGIISAAMVMLNVNNNSSNTSIVNDTNSTNKTINNNISESNNITKNVSNSSSTKKNKSKSKKSKSYRPAVDSEGITREVADEMGYRYTPEHGGHYIGSHDYWDPEAGCYHD